MILIYPNGNIFLKKTRKRFERTHDRQAIQYAFICLVTDNRSPEFI